LVDFWHCGGRDGLDRRVHRLIAYYDHLPDHLSQHETLVLGQNQLVPGSPAAMRVVVRDSRDGTPLADAKVEVKLRSIEGGGAKTLFKGVTDASGNVAVSFDVPEDVDPKQTLIVETKSRLGSDTRGAECDGQARLPHPAHHRQTALPAGADHPHPRAGARQLRP
jgi:hypothetical protein